MLRPRTLRALLVPFLAFALLAPAASTARADDEESAKLEVRGKALRYAVATANPANKIDTGGAAIFVNAPIEVVRKIVTDYPHYASVVKAFHQSRLLSRKDGESEVYLDVPIAHGAAHVWAVVKMGKPVVTGETETITGRFVKGNIDDFRAVWRLRRIDDAHTVLKLEVFVDPQLPLPASLVTPELSYAADRAVTGVRDEAQRRVGATPASPVADTSPDKKPNVAKR